MREYLMTLRALLAGETVTHEGKAITLMASASGSTPRKSPSRWARSARRC